MVRLTAAAGERNAVLVSAQGTTVLVEERGLATLTSDGTCAISGRVANCGSGVLAVVVALGDKQDQLLTSTQPVPPGLPVTADGGDGDDTLQDQPGDDTIAGGPGDDVVFDTSGGRDRYSGGDGRDTIAYPGTGDVHVSADGVADDGLAGEGDDVAPDFEDLQGGDGDDVLSGTGAPNTITGGPGDDFVSGAGAADVLDGGDGRDTLVGGDGPDGLSGGDADDLLYGQGGGDTLVG